MTRSRTAIVAMSAWLALGLAGCGGGPGGGRGGGTTDTTGNVPPSPPQGAPGLVAHLRALPDTVTPDTSCSTKSGNHTKTGPIGWISVDSGQSSVKPDTIVQPRSNGAMLWGMARGQAADSFRVHFTAGSPLSSDTYDSNGKDLVGGQVRPEAECRTYPYTVTVWSGGQSTTIDPDGTIVPG